MTWRATCVSPYLKEALAWLVHRENTNALPPFWTHNNSVYENILAGWYSSQCRPSFLELDGILFHGITRRGITRRDITRRGITRQHDVILHDLV